MRVPGMSCVLAFHLIYSVILDEFLFRPFPIPVPQPVDILA